MANACSEVHCGGEEGHSICRGPDSCHYCKSLGSVSFGFARLPGAASDRADIISLFPVLCMVDLVNFSMPLDDRLCRGRCSI